MARIRTSAVALAMVCAGAIASPDPPADPNRQEMAGLARQRAAQEDNGGTPPADPSVTPQPPAQQALPPQPPPHLQQPPRDQREGENDRR
jgi:hypothetical protein